MKPLQWLVAALFSVCVVVALTTPGRRSKIARFLGGLSFPLYLNHWRGLYLTDGVARRLGLLDLPGLPFLSYFAALAITVPLYLLVDRNAMAWQNSCYSPALGRRLGQMTYTLVAVGLVLGLVFHTFGPHGVVPPGVQ